ncbi:MAG: VOC family protein, partial [Acidimicrobiia bacterium]|nr:VOC family protein [Acidimicrobiia bacterium]
MVRIAPHLWFDNDAAEAVAFYLSVFPHGEIISDVVFGSDGEGPGGARPSDVQVIDFRIGNLELTA